MSTKTIKKRAAITLIELLIASLVFTIVAYGIYRVWSHITFNQAVSEARGQAKSDVDMILRHLNRDIAMARAGTLSGGPGGGITMDITRKGSGSTAKTIKVTYTRNAEELTRNEAGDAVLLTRNLDTFDWEREVASGVIYLKVSAKVKVKGSETTQEHTQDSFATIREEATSSGVDSRWKTSSDILDSW